MGAPVAGGKAWLVYSAGSAICVTAVGIVAYLFGSREAEPKPVDPVVQARPEPVVEAPKPKVYDWSRLTPFRTLESPRGRPTAIAFSADGRYLAAGSDIKPVREPGPNQTGEPVVPNSGEVRIWDITENRIETTFPVDITVWSMGFSPDAKTFVVDGEGGGVVLNPGTWSNRFRFDDPLSFSVAFSADSKTFYCGSSRIGWEAGTGAKVANSKIADDFDHLAFSPDGKLFSAGPFVLDYPSMVVHGKPLANLVYARRFTPDGKILVSLGTETLDTWDVSSPSTIRLIKSVERAPMRTADFGVSSDSRACAMIREGQVRIYSLPDLTKVKDVETPSSVAACGFQPAGDLLAILTERHGLILLKASPDP